MQNSKRNLLLFVGLLLLAGLFHIIEHTIHDISALGEPHYAVVTLFFCLELVIYTVLIIFWIQSVHTRLLPSRARNYMVIVALLMIFYLVLRAYKYRIAGEDAGLRLSWYAYYIPMTFIPALFLMVCIRIKKGAAKLKVDEKVFLIPAAVLSGLIMTNDLHHLIFVPEPGLSNFIGKSGTYTYRVTFYITYAWIVLAILAGIILLIRTFGLKQKRRLLYLGGIIAVWVILTQLHTLKKIIEFTPPYETPEIHIFTMLAVFEFAIRQRLIPYNENYAGFFASLPMPVMITDKNFNPVYRSAGSIDLEPGLLTEALKAPIYPIPDGNLSGRPTIRGGEFTPGVYSVSANVGMGLNTNASLDGRRAAEPISDNIGPVHTAAGSHDIKGPTAIANSVSKVDHSLATNGTLLNVKFPEDAVAGRVGRDNLIGFIDGYFAGDPMHIQFNIMSSKTMRAAQIQPENYKDMLVRVAGYSAYFVELGKELQDDLIQRTELRF